MSDTLLIFNLPAQSDLRHTHLTRLEGEAPDLPPLAEWLGLDALETDRIEMFPIADLGGMSLSTYLQSAFDPEPDALEASGPYIDAIQGSVLIIPETAMTGELSLSQNVERVAGLPLIAADHSADLPKADLSTPPLPEEKTAQPAPTKRRAFMVLLATLLSLILVLVWYLT